MAWPAVLPITWTSETRSGLTKTTRRLEAREPVSKAVSASGTRISSRSAKAKGKEPDVSHPVVISEDSFELVMGIYEKLTSEKYEYLHHVGIRV